MVTETQLGNYYPSANKNKIVFSSMGNNGFDITPPVLKKWRVF